MSKGRNGTSDLLTGCAAIAEHLSWTERQVKHRVATGELPTFRIGRTICARRGDLAAHFARARSTGLIESRVSTVHMGGSEADGKAASATLNGHRAIAAYLSMPVTEIARLDLERRLPTYLDDGCTVASTAALDHWNSMKGGR